MDNLAHDMSNIPVSPPPVPDAPPASTVRRHHTITATSRATRAGSRLAAEDAEQPWNDDEVVDQDWVGGVGAVGEKNANLHRQASLPTRYNRAFPRSSQNRQAGNLTPRTINSLTVIAAEHGHEGEDEDWEREMHGWRNEEDQQEANLAYQQMLDSQSQGSSHSPLSPAFPPDGPSPPQAAANIRRHQSLTYGAAGGNVKRMSGASGLRRSGTLQAQIERHGAHGAVGSQPSPSPPSNDGHLAEEEGYEDEDYQYAAQQQQQQQQSQSQLGHAHGQYTPNSVGRSSPWGSSGSIDWKYNTGAAQPNTASFAMDDVQRALSALDMSGGGGGGSGFVDPSQPLRSPGLPGQTALPPRLAQQGLSVPNNNNNSIGNNAQYANARNGNGGNMVSGMMSPPQQHRHRNENLQYANDMDNDIRGQQLAVGGGLGGMHHKVSQQSLRHQRTGSGGQSLRDEGPRGNLTPSGAWDQQDRGLTSRNSNSNLRYTGGYDASDLPPNPPIPAQYLNQQQQAQRGMRQGATSPYAQLGQAIGQGPISLGSGQQQVDNSAFMGASVDVASLIASKGYNPATFDVNPPFARFFVIKSYTEDDVHKSLKYEIWSSTDPGNKRLDKAFKETGGRGPIYLFFSVNASGHFCGMAEMMTAVDYSRSSTVWASDKWKGVFKVRWIFVRDIPNANLRHIKLQNTQERKPVTNSRDTQELLPEAGQEMLRIFFSHPARTSLLQDYAFYELQALQKQQQPASPPPTSQSPQPQMANQAIQQHPFAMPNPYAGQPMPLTPSLSPMMPMGMNSPYNHPQAIQNMMRGPSPVPLNGGQGYLGANAGF